MKIIYKGIIVELLLNFDANRFAVFCTKTISPSGNVVNYADLNTEKFEISGNLIDGLENYSALLLAENFSWNNLLVNVFKSIDEKLES